MRRIATSPALLVLASLVAVSACSGGRSLTPAPPPPAMAAATGAVSGGQSTQVWIKAESGGSISLPDGSSVSIPAGLLSENSYVTISSAPRGPLPSANVVAASRSTIVSFSTPISLRKRMGGAEGTTTSRAGLRISVAGLANLKMSGPTAVLFELTSSAGTFAFVAAPDGVVTPGQPATVSLTRSLLNNVSEIRATLISLRRLTVSVPPPQYLYVNGSLAVWASQPHLAPHKRTLVLVHGMHSTVDNSSLSAFSADCANKIRVMGNYDQVVGFNYDYTLPVFGAHNIFGSFPFGSAIAPKDSLVAFIRSLNQNSIDIEAHSYGTVVTLAALPEIGPLVKNVVLLAGPLPNWGMGVPITGDPIADSETREIILAALTAVVHISLEDGIKMSGDGWVDDIALNAAKLTQISAGVRGMPIPPTFTELAATMLPAEFGLSSAEFNSINALSDGDPTDGAVLETAALSTDFAPYPASMKQSAFATTHVGITCDDSDATQFVANSIVKPPPTTVPSVSTVWPMTVSPGGQSYQLTILGSSFASGNVVQFKRGLGPNASAWTNADSSTTLNSGQISVSLNAPVSDTIYVRVCTGGGDLSDCSDGTPFVSVAGPAVGPSVSSISPTSITAGGQSQRLFIYGTFATGDVVQFKRGQGSDANVWMNAPSAPTVTSSQITVYMDARTVADTVYVRVCDNSPAVNCSDGSESVSVSGLTFVPSVSSISPTGMSANGQNQTLYIYGSSFTSHDVVQFKWGQGVGANIWTISKSTPTITPSQISVSMNPGTLTDSIYVRVCRQGSSTCSDGTQYVSVTAPGTITEFTIPTANSGPNAITVGPDGALWFTENPGNKIGRVTTRGVFTEYPIPTAGSSPAGITAGPDGALWFTEDGSDPIQGKVGRVTTSGLFSEYPIPSVSYYHSNPIGIITGPDGALWFADSELSSIGRFTTSGALTQYTTPSAVNGLFDGSSPTGITVGPDGALWFTEQNSAFGNKIGRVTTAGVFTEYTPPSANSAPTSITLGPDGALWFTEENAFRIGRVTTSGAFTEYVVPTHTSSAPFGITTGPDGALWFTDIGNGFTVVGKIGRVTTSGALTEYTLPTANSYPYAITTGPDGALWFVETGNNKIGRLTP